MNLFKKFVSVLALSIGVAGCFSNLYAAQTSSYYDEIADYGFSQSRMKTTTTDEVPSFSGGSTTKKHAPNIELSRKEKDSTVYLIIYVSEEDASVRVEGSSSGIQKYNSHYYYYKVTKSDTYDVEAWTDYDYVAYDSLYVNTSASTSTKLNLSKKYEDDKCYLVIEADDDDGIKSVAVNDEKITFSSTGGTENYRVYNSGTYTVVLTDKDNNKTTKSLYINVNENGPTLTLSDETKSGKCYLVIKADSDYKITKVTVDGKSISFPEAGGTEKYEVTKTGTYKVVVTDKEGYTVTKSLYIKVGGSSDAPKVTLSQNYKTNNGAGWYLLINATDDGSIASVTVNGTNVTFDSNKGIAQYYVPVDGNYTVVVTDDDGNSTTKTTYAAGNAGISDVTNTVSNTGNTKIVFKLNSKTWTQNGVAQEQMTVAPRSINSRVYLPIRYIAYALDIDSGQINWNPTTQTVTIYDSNNTIQVKIGSKTMYVNGSVITMDSAPTSVGGRVMLPISQIKSAFANKNIQLSWDNTSKQLTIIR